MARRNIVAILLPIPLLLLLQFQQPFLHNSKFSFALAQTPPVEVDKNWPQNYPGQVNISQNLPWVHADGHDSSADVDDGDAYGRRDEESQEEESWEEEQQHQGPDEENEQPQRTDVDKVDDDKWPQNYPGGGGVHFRGSHHKGQGRQYHRPGSDRRGPFFPGHIGHWPGRHEWEDDDGRNREHQGQQGQQDNDMEHNHQQGPWKEHELRSGWLDWIFPWRKHMHQQHQNNEDRGRDLWDPREHRNRTREDDDDDVEEDDDVEDHHQHRKANKSVFLHLSGGRVRGLVSYAAGRDRPANVFKGIPFAEPPLGKLRFSPLRKKKQWNGIWEATKYRAACLSNTTRTRSPQHYISEDCIYMNVFVDPKCQRTKACPVLFYVHGGGFAYDSATMFNDTQIVQKYASDGVVFMIPAYRLGVFGFLDLGSDRTTKRNLGMHDIIFALNWARKEIRAFGGDPERITIMGNSAGASAVSYLCASPAVDEKHFQQAIISSGVPFFTPNANLNQTNALLEHFNCTRNNATNRTLSDRQKVECLRRVDSMELLREQQRNEERGIVFSGPEEDTEILPAKNYVELMKHWTPMPMLKMTTKYEMYYTPDERLEQNCVQDMQIMGYRSKVALQHCIQRYNATFTEECESIEKARPLLYVTTKHEFNRWADNRLPGECMKALVPLGYTSNSSFQACMNRYNKTFWTNNHMRVSYESMHAEAFLTSLVNTRLGGVSYVGEFELANYSNHADDLYFFFGLHYIPLNTSDVKLMDMYYPKIIKNFLRGHAPDKIWKPQNWNGRNFFRIAFNASDNGTLVEWPHAVDGYQDVEGLNFWLRDMAIVEKNARMEERKQLRNETDQQTWQDVFGGGGNNSSRNTTIGSRHGHGHRHNELLPGLNSFIALPPEHKNSTLEKTGAGSVAPGPPAIGTNLMSEELPADDSATYPLSETVPQSAALKDDADGLNQQELGKVWSAFWLTMTVTILLSVAVFLFAVTKAVYRYKNVRGYTPAPEGNGGIFTEKSRIIHANGNNSMRYM